MSAPCITCGDPIGETSPQFLAARAKLRLPDPPPKKCLRCTWKSLLRLRDEERYHAASVERAEHVGPLTCTRCHYAGTGPVVSRKCGRRRGVDACACACHALREGPPARGEGGGE